MHKFAVWPLCGEEFSRSVSQDLYLFGQGELQGCAGSCVCCFSSLTIRDVFCPLAEMDRCRPQRGTRSARIPAWRNPRHNLGPYNSHQFISSLGRGMLHWFWRSTHRGHRPLHTIVGEPFEPALVRTPMRPLFQVLQSRGRRGSLGQSQVPPRLPH